MLDPEISRVAVKQEVEQDEAEQSKPPPAKKRRLMETNAPNTPSADARPIGFKAPAQSDITPGETCLQLQILA